MKHQNEIDQLFEEQLGKLSVEPSADSWETIVSSLDAAPGGINFEAKRRRKLFIYAFIGTVAAILAYVLFFNQGRSRNIAPSEQIIVKLKKNQTKESTNPLSNTTSEHQNSRSKHLNNTSKKNRQHQAVQDNKEQLDNQFAEPLTYPQHKTEIKSKQDTQDKHSTLITTSVAFAEEAFDATEESLRKVNQNDIYENSVEEAAEIKMVTAKTQELNNDKGVAVENQVVVKDKTKEKGELVEQINNKANNLESATQLIPEKEQVVANVDINKKDKVANVDNEDALALVPSPSGIYRSTGWSLDGFIGPALITSNDNYIAEQVEAGYQIDNKPQIITPNVGLNIKYHINNWFIKSGIAYSEFGENRNYLQDIELHDTNGYSKQNIYQYYTYDTTGWVNDPNNPGVLIPVFDAIYHSDTTCSWVSRDSVYYEHIDIYAQNRFRYIEVPIMLGYEFRLKNIGLEVATGISIGFRVNSSGKFLNYNNDLVDVNPSNNPYSNMMMNYILSVGVKYHLTNRFSIIAQPIYKTNLNSIIESNFGSDTRYTSIGLNVGVNYIIK